MRPVEQKRKFLSVALLVVATVLVIFRISCLINSRLRVGVRFLGYRNTPELHVGLVQVSNASSFTVVRRHSPSVVFASPTLPINYAPTGWRVLQPGESEEIITESITNGLRWRLTVSCQPFGHDDYGLTSENRFAIWQRETACWLRDHHVPIPAPRPRPATEFSSEWIQP